MLQSRSSEKKNGETRKNCCCMAEFLKKKRVCMGHAQNEKQFFEEITKADNKHSKIFYLKNFTELGIFFYFVCFLPKMVISS